MQGEVLDDDLDDDNDNNNDDIDDNNNKYNCFGMEYNATVYDGRENTVAAFHLSRLSASPNCANVAACIDPDLSTLSRNGLIAAANEALRLQRSLDLEVAVLQEGILSIWNQSQFYNSTSEPV